MSENPIAVGSRVYLKSYPPKGVGLVRTIYTTDLDIGSVAFCWVDFPSCSARFLEDELAPLPAGGCDICGHPDVAWHIQYIGRGVNSFYYTCPACRFSSPGRPSVSEALAAAAAAVRMVVVP